VRGVHTLIDIQPIQWKQHSNFIDDYRNHHGQATNFFSYKPYESLASRHAYVMKQRYPRQPLVDALKQMHENWGAPEHTYTYIETLLDEESTVVIGGQQAGVLTGPLYSMNKLISIIAYAREQEKTLKKPVLPVFWIAGEDHDFDEINHVFIQEKNELHKHRIHQIVSEKATVSSTKIDHGIVGKWVDVVFASLAETVHIRDVYNMVHRCLQASETYVDFFARMLFELLPDESFILIDSADPRTRDIEKPFFKQLITHQQQIATSIYHTDVTFTREGYDSIVDVSPNDGHLFYHVDGERILLERDTRNNWVGKQDEISFTNEELLRIATKDPHLLSNNVMTRPLMQEMLFPTLAFVGGNGEITYWALLKKAFQVIGCEMPPVIPRLSFTYIDQKTNQLLKKLHVDVTDAIEHGVHTQQFHFIRKQSVPPIDTMMSTFKKQIKQLYEPLHQFARDIRGDMGELAEKNEEIVLKELTYLQKRIQQATEEQVTQVIEQYDFINTVIHPHRGLQERVWNPVPLLVGEGLSIFESLLQKDFDFKQPHYAVYV